MNYSEEEFGAARALLARLYQFKQKRQQGKVQRITNSKKKRLNKAQKRRGVDYTCAARGMVPYAAVGLTEFVEIITKELAARHVQVQPGTKIKALLVLLKIHKTNRQKQNTTEKEIIDGFKALTKFKY